MLQVSADIFFLVGIGVSLFPSGKEKQLSLTCLYGPQLD